MNLYYNLKLTQSNIILSEKDKELNDAKYNLFVSRDRYESAKLKYIGDRELSDIQKDKIMKPQLNRILNNYIKLLYLYDKYEPDTLQIDKLIDESNKLGLRIYYSDL
jgi:hypothetical protein